MSIIGLDIGTSGCKATAFDENANVLAYAYKEYSLITPQPCWVEVDPNFVWKSIATVIREVATKVPKTNPIQAMSISSMGDTITPVSSRIEPTYNSILAFDTRTGKQADQLREKLGMDKVFQITGMPIHSMYSLCKIMWLKQEMPDVYAKTWKFLTYEDFVVAKLGLEPTISYPLACRTMAFDEKAKQWSDEILQAVDIPASKFSRPVPSGTVLGTIGPEIASSLGLPKGVQLVSGGHDVTCGAVGTGVVTPGLIHDVTGTFECIVGVFQNQVNSSELLKAQCCWYCHSVPDTYVIMGFISTAGSALRWYRDRFGSEEIQKAKASGQDSYTVLMKTMPDQPSPVIVVPYFAGSGSPTFDPRARGMVFGLEFGSTRGDFVKGILQGVTHEFAWNLDLMEKSGMEINEIRCTGGGARSEEWLQLKADITGRKVVSMVIDEAGSLGAAILAGVGVGMFSSISDAVHKVIKVKKVYQPNPEKRKFYIEQTKRYRNLILNLSKIW